MVARGEAPQGAKTPGIGHKNKCEPRQGWHNAWREIPHCFKIPLTQKTLAHNGSELRFATVLAHICRPTLRRFAPSLRALFSFFLRYPGFHGFAVPPRAILFRPCRGSNIGSLTLAITSSNSNLASCMKSIENSFSIFLFDLLKFVVDFKHHNKSEFSE